MTNKIGRKSDLSQFEIGFISGQLNVKPKKTAVDIRDSLEEAGFQRSYLTVQRAICKLEKGIIITSENRQNCGRKPKIGKETGMKIIKEVEKNRQITTEQICKLSANYKKNSR